MATENQIDCPALHQRSDIYPFGDRVPRTVRMLKTVTADPMPGIGLSYIKGDAPVAKAGQTYPVWTNSHGAVTAVVGNGVRLGLRPAEFEVDSWHELAGGQLPSNPEQPHAEPIAWMVGTAFWWTKEEAERDAADTGLPIVGLGPMTGAAPAEQTQGEPVALPKRKDPTSEWAVPGGVSKAEGWNACLDEIAKLGPLYTRADPAGAERLRDALRLAKHWCDAALNAIQMGSDNPDAPNDVACLLRHMAKDLDSTAPASAEPSAPVERAICRDLGGQCMECEEAEFREWADRHFASADYRKTAAGVFIQDWMRHAYAAWCARAALARKA